MKNILQRIAYVQGLADGLGLEDTSKEGQILLELVDVVEEDLAELEDYVYEEDDFDDYDDFDLDDYDFFDEYHEANDEGFEDVEEEADDVE